MRKHKKRKVRKEKPDASVYEDCARVKFCEALRVVMPTPNYEDYFFWHEDRMLDDDHCVGVISLDCMHNHQLGLDWSLKNTVHIRSLGVANDDRGIGYFNCLCSLLIRIAEENNVFLFGTAVNFRYEIPRIETPEQGLEFLEWRDKQWYSMKTDKTMKQKSLVLKDAYLRNGFCSYDASGYAHGDKFFKKTSFGYLSSGADLDGVGDYFDHHLKCAI